MDFCSPLSLCSLIFGVKKRPVNERYFLHCESLYFLVVCAIMKTHYHEGSANGEIPKRRPSFLLEFDFILNSLVVEIIVILITKSSI